MVKRSSEWVRSCSFDGMICQASIAKEKMQSAIPEMKPLEGADIQRILESSKSGKSSQVIAHELQYPHWAIVLILSLYK